MLYKLVVDCFVVFNSVLYLTYYYNIENITYQLGSAYETNVPSQSVDVVTVAQAMHWFELDKFFEEVDLDVYLRSSSLSCIDINFTKPKGKKSSEAKGYLRSFWVCGSQVEPRAATSVGEGDFRILFVVAY